MLAVVVAQGLGNPSGLYQIPAASERNLGVTQDAVGRRYGSKWFRVVVRERGSSFACSSWLGEVWWLVVAGSICREVYIIRPL